MNEALIHEIVVRFRGGASMRHIAQSLGISRRTVKQVLDQVEQNRGVGSTEQAPRKKARRCSQLDAHLGTITELLSRYPNITAQRIYEELRRHGYQGSYSLLSHRVYELRPRPIVRPVQRFETAPGKARRWTTRPTTSISRTKGGPGLRIQLYPGLLSPAVSSFRRESGLRHDRPPAHPHLRAHGRRRGVLSL